MFNPTREQVRHFFCDTWAKYRSASALAGLETQAVDIMLLHPEYHAMLEQPLESSLRDYTPENGQINPFLHLSLHLAIEEQLSLDQPRGIRSEYERLLGGGRDRHEALHVLLECLGETMWRAQREGSAPDETAYLECLRRA